MTFERKTSLWVIIILTFFFLDVICLLVVQSLNHVQLFAIPWNAANQVSLSFLNSQSLLKFISIESIMLFNHLIL